MAVYRIFQQPDAWQHFRKEGAPAQLAISVLRMELAGQRWLVTKGANMFGLPEMFYKVNNSKYLNLVPDIFYNMFYYMFEHGPVVKAGHTGEVAEEPNLIQRFAHLAKEDEPLAQYMDTTNALALTLEPTKKSWSLFR